MKAKKMREMNAEALVTRNEGKFVERFPLQSETHQV